ncbi:MAG: hypothetical protein OHK0053_05250 [Microscillaceae bacterium]
MGIEEAILQEVEERGLQQGLQQGVQQGALQTKIAGIRKALTQGKLSLEEIAELFEVSLDFVKEMMQDQFA